MGPRASRDAQTGERARTDAFARVCAPAGIAVGVEVEAAVVPIAVRWTVAHVDTGLVVGFRRALATVECGAPCCGAGSSGSNVVVRL